MGLHKGMTAGTTAVHDFVVSDEDMELFQRLSGDRSAIHTDDAYARSRGFERSIVYGGIMLAQLSHVLGTMIPGDRGTSLHWRIDYRRALYVGERATLAMEVVNISESTGVIEAKFSISANQQVIATGKTQSLLPPEDLENAA